MKKIGLATFYEADNYGTCLQAYALQTIIVTLGYDCEIIRFDRNVARPQTSIFNKVRSVGLKRTTDIILCKNSVQKQKVKFAEFRKKCLKYSPYLYCSIAEVNNANLQYDAFVTGSDMVWSWESRQFLDFYFLKFAKEGRRISYAPSFGNTRFDEEMSKYYTAAVAGIDYCSCREENGQRYINEKLNKECVLAIDPTLLIPQDEWNSLIRGTSDRNKNILLYMFGDIPQETRDKISVLKKRGYVIHYIPQTYYQYRYEKKYGNDAFGPLEFLKAFRDSDFVITNTYHGLMFSLVYKKPFIMYHRDSQEHWNIHEERMQSVLNMLDLKERYLSFGDEIKDEYLELDYVKVDDILNKQIMISRDFLKNSLKKASERD